MSNSTMTLADLQAAEAPAKEAAPATPVQEIPAAIVHNVKLSKLGTERRRTSYFATDGLTKVSAYLPGKLPETLKGQSLELGLADASSSTKKGKTSLTWEQETAEGLLSVFATVPAKAKHVTSVTVNFPKGK